MAFDGRVFAASRQGLARLEDLTPCRGSLTRSAIIQRIMHPAIPETAPGIFMAELNRYSPLAA